MEMLIDIGIFGLISAIVYFVLAPRGPVAEDAIQQRLENIGLQTTQSRTPNRLHEEDELTIWERFANFFLGDKELPERFGNVSRRLHQAGYRGNRAVRIFWGLRFFLCIAFGFGGMSVAIMSNAAMSDFLLLSGVGALVGFMLPALTIFR